MKLPVRVILSLILIVLFLFVLIIYQSTSSFPSGDLSSLESFTVIHNLKSAGSNVKRRQSENESTVLNIFQEKEGARDGDDIVAHSFNTQCEDVKFPHAKANLDTYKLLMQVQNEEAWGEYYDIKKNTFSHNFTRPNFTRPLTVIVVPFSHNDPGWLKTVDEYYNDQTSHILDNMISKLTKYPDLTFMWEETVFLSMWWERQNDTTRAQTRRLIERGQLGISIGSWVMPDEANPHYFALIDQMIEGHSWLEENLGPKAKPVNAWGVDPFGYSSTLTYLYKRAGLENMIILRIHELVKVRMKAAKALHFRWRQEWDEIGNLDMLTYLMPSFLYHVSETCGPDPRICEQFDFSPQRVQNMRGAASQAAITNDNVHERAAMLLDQFHKKSEDFLSHVLFVPLGADFKFVKGDEWDWQYGNYSKLFQYINTNTNWNTRVKFGTTKDYFDALKIEEKDKHTNVTRFPSLVGDFFPYVDDSRYHWVGFYTTRQMSKVLGREVEIHLRAAEILHSFALALEKQNGHAKERRYPKFDQILQRLTLARQELALFQHHDSITGTSKAKPTKYSQQRLTKGLVAAMDVVENCTSSILDLPREKALHMTAPKYLRLRMPDRGAVQVFLAGTKLVMFNSKMSNVEELVRLTVDSPKISVRDYQGRKVRSQINPVWEKNHVPSIKYYELLFLIKMPALGLVTYTLYPVKNEDKSTNMDNHPAEITLAVNDIPGKKSGPFVFKDFDSKMNDFSIENEHYSLSFQAKNGMLASTFIKQGEKTVVTELSLNSYIRSAGGAYVFSPMSAASGSSFRNAPRIHVYKGIITDEVHVMYPTVTHSISLVKSSRTLGLAIEINNIVHLKDRTKSEETVMRLDSKINSNHHFYTDLNGFKVVQRKKYTEVGEESNYYPMTSFAFIQDKKIRASLLSAQPVGVTSQDIGGLELMLHRQILNNDFRGMDEPVQDTTSTPSRFYLLLEQRQSSRDTAPGYPSAFVQSSPLPRPTLLTHHLVDHLRNYPIVLFSEGSDEMHPTLQFATSSLPCDMELVNLRSLAKPSGIGSASSNAALILHRLSGECGPHSHTLAEDLGCEHSPRGQVIPSKLFRGIVIKNTRVKSLSLMYDMDVVPDGSKVTFEQMELTAFNVSLV